MPLSLPAPLLFGLFAAMATSIGLIAVALSGSWSRRYAGLFALAAAGMLITMSLTHIAPEAMAFSDLAPSFMAGGFFGGLLMGFVIRALFPDTGEGGKAGAITPIAAIALHSFIDGVIYSVTFAASYASGVSAASALIVHEFPEAVIAFAILQRHGFSTRDSLLWAFAAAAMTTPLGALAATPVMSTLTPESVGLLFAISAGLLLYVATGPLMAPLKDETPARALPALATGVAAAVILSLSPLHDEAAHMGHGHGPGEHVERPRLDRH